MIYAIPSFIQHLGFVWLSGESIRIAKWVRLEDDFEIDIKLIYLTVQHNYEGENHLPQMLPHI